jgi:transposase
MSRKHYPSDISRDQFSKIQSMLEQARRKTRPRTVDLYDVFCGVLYVLKSGCQWRMIPSDFPKWRTVYAYFQIWSQTQEDQSESLLTQALKKNGWRGPYQPWQTRENNLLHRRCAKRQEHGHSQDEGV